MVEEVDALQSKHEASLAQMKKSHASEMGNLRQQMLEELQKLKDSLKLEKETEISALRKVLAAEQVSEEAALRAKKAASLAELKTRLEEEQEEEEAKLMEEKENTLRTLKQQVHHGPLGFISSLLFAFSPLSPLLSSLGG